MRSGGRAWYRLEGAVAGVACVAVAASLWGWHGLASPVAAQTGTGDSAATSDYSTRPVAYVYGSQVITRRDLGEYLIARQGSERLDLLVNKVIIERECKKRGVQVTAADVEQALAQDLKGMNMQQKDFVAMLLKRYNKTLYEWKEDVVRPRLQLNQLCKGEVQVTDEDLQKAFEAHYGEKVHCKLIMWPKDAQSKRNAMEVYPQIHDSDAEFDRVAKAQLNPKLQAAAGEIPPFGRYTTGNEELEKAVFALKPGEITQIIEAPEGYVVLKLLDRVPPEKGKKLADVREELSKEVFDKKLQQEIPLYFKKLRDEARPTLLMQKPYINEEDWFRDIHGELSDGQSAVAPPHMPMQGN